MRRIVFRGILGIALVGVIGYVAFQLFLHSGYATGMVAAKLQAKLGVPVTVGRVDIGMSSCAACELAISEVGTTSLPPFLTIARAEVNLKPSDLLNGVDPTSVILHDAKLVIRHDRDGHLLTRFPHGAATSEVIPEFHVRNATVTVKRDGTPDCHFQGINATLHADAGRLHLNGTVSDPNWGGQWMATASAPLDGSSGILSLSSTKVHVTPDELRRIPYISEKIWKHFIAEGDTPVNLQLKMSGPNEKVRYRLELSPVNTKFHVSSIDLHAEQTRGHVVIEDNLIVLRDIRGKVADGELYLKEAQLDFRQPQHYMHYVLEANRLSLKGLPTSWKLPPRLGGLLTGNADLTVRVIGGRTIPTGSGDCRVDGATLGMFPIPNYGLKLQADVEGIRFEPRLGTPRP